MPPSCPRTHRLPAPSGRRDRRGSGASGEVEAPERVRAILRKHQFPVRRRHNQVRDSIGDALSDLRTCRDRRIGYSATSPPRPIRPIESSPGSVKYSAPSGPTVICDGSGAHRPDRRRQRKFRALGISPDKLEPRERRPRLGDPQRPFRRKRQVYRVVSDGVLIEFARAGYVPVNLVGRHVQQPDGAFGDGHADGCRRWLRIGIPERDTAPGYFVDPGRPTSRGRTDVGRLSSRALREDASGRASWPRSELAAREPVECDTARLGFHYNADTLVTRVQLQR
jgi:hypothetical protein